MCLIYIYHRVAECHWPKVIIPCMSQFGTTLHKKTDFVLDFGNLTGNRNLLHRT